MADEAKRQESAGKKSEEAAEQPKEAVAGTAEAEAAEKPLAPVVARGFFGGLLMGLANLVPGISGGTMLLASGVYQDFVDAIAGLTHLKFTRRALTVLFSVGAMAACSILLFAGPVKALVVEHRWVMYSLFIGLTLGGIPVLWKLIKAQEGQQGGGGMRAVWISALLGFLAMLAIAFVQMRGAGSTSTSEIPWPMFLLGGALGASAMVLPGVSGGYLLLLLGQYVPILGAIDEMKTALIARDISAALSPALGVLLPVGLGVLAGIALVSNLLKFLFARFERQTLGVLLGFLAGAVAGLWPFQEGVRPALGFVFKGRVLATEAEIDAIRASWPTEFFTPSVLHVLGALLLIAAGFGLTLVVDKIGTSAGKNAVDAPQKAP